MKYGNMTFSEQAENGFVLTASETVNLLTSDSTAEKQAKIDALPKVASANVTVTFQFEDGTHNETGRLLFQGFTYPIDIFGNPSDNSLSTSKSVDLKTTDNNTNIRIAYCVFANVRYLDIEVRNTSAEEAIEVSNSSGDILYCYIHGVAKTNTNFGVFYENSKGYVNACYISNVARGIYASRNSQIMSHGNDDTGTAPSYGLYVYSGAIIGKIGTQPAGSIASESGNGSNGCVIR